MTKERINVSDLTGVSSFALMTMLFVAAAIMEYAILLGIRRIANNKRVGEEAKEKINECWTSSGRVTRFNDIYKVFYHLFGHSASSGKSKSKSSLKQSDKKWNLFEFESIDNFCFKVDKFSIILFAFSYTIYLTQVSMENGFLQ